MRSLKQIVQLHLILILMMTLLTGCWDRRELDELAIEVAEGIDKDGDLYRLTVQVVDPGQVGLKGGGGGSRSPIITYSMTGKTIFEATRKMSTFTPRQLYGAHLRMLVIGESAARDGISEVIDIYARDNEFRTDFFIVVAKGTTAENVLKLTTPLEKIPANSLFYTLQTSEQRWAPSLGIPLHQFIDDLTSGGKEPALTAISVKGDQDLGETLKNEERSAPETLMQYVGLALFKDDKLIDWLNEEESKGVTYILDRVKNTIAVVPCPSEGRISLEIVKSKSNVQGTVKNGKPYINVELQSEAIIGEVLCNVDISNKATINELTQSVEQHLEKLILGTVRKAQNRQADVFGFGEVMYRTNPTYWKKVKDHWDEVFGEAEVHVNVNVKIKSSGTIGNAFKKKGRKNSE